MHMIKTYHIEKEGLAVTELLKKDSNLQFKIPIATPLGLTKTYKKGKILRKNLSKKCEPPKINLEQSRCGDLICW